MQDQPEKPAPKIHTLFHGSQHRPGVKAFGLPGNREPQVSPGRPFFLTDNLRYATRFARGGLVSSVRLSTERVIDLHDEEALSRLLEVYNADPKILATDGPWDSDFEGDISDQAYRLLDSPAVMTFLQSKGYQAVFLPEDIELNVTSYAVIDPACTEFLRLVSVDPENDFGCF